MKENLTNSEKLAEIVDKIFLLNHNIVNVMLSSYRDENMKRVPILNRAVEKLYFNKLSEYYEELRDVIREAIDIGDEINRGNIEGLYDEETANEVVFQSRENVKQSLIKAMQSRVQALYVSMNFVPITVRRQGVQGQEVIESIYAGTPEEALRAHEFSMLQNSFEKQIDIIEYEDFFEQIREKETFIISPIIVPELLDSIAAKSKHTLAEEQCRKFATESREQEEIFDEYPELKEVTEFSEYLMLEERYRGMFEKATGPLNERTTYGNYFFSLYKDGLLPMYTGFSQEEISTRVKNQVETYSERNKQIIKTEFEMAIERYKSIRKKRNVREISNTVRGRINRLGKNYTRRSKTVPPTVPPSDQNKRTEEPKEGDVR